MERETNEIINEIMEKQLGYLADIKTEDAIARIKVANAIAHLVEAITEYNYLKASHNSGDETNIPLNGVDIRKKGIGSLGLHERIERAILSQGGKWNVGRLCKMTERELLKLPWVGTVGVEEVKAKLQSCGLGLRDAS